MSGCECEIITADSCTDGNHNHSTTLLHFLFDGARGRTSDKSGKEKAVEGKETDRGASMEKMRKINI